MAEVPIPQDRLLVVTMDRRRSRDDDEDVIPAAAKALNRRYRSRLALRFSRTVGDELQAATREAGWIVDLILDVARSEEWWLGVGYGPYEQPLRRTARESRGPAFYAAREAVESAKVTAPGIAVVGPASFEPFSDAMLLLISIVRRRTARQHEAAVLYRELESMAAVARRLALSPSSVTERLQGAGMQEEQVGRRLALHLLQEGMKNEAS